MVLGLIFQNDVAVVVAHLGVRPRRGVNAAVGKRGVGRGHFTRGHALGKAAERQRARRRHIVVRQRRKAEILGHKGVGRGQRQLDGRAHRRGVGRIADGVLQRHDAAVARVGVHRPGTAVEHLNRIVVDHARGRDDACVQRGRVNAQGLDGRAALTHNRGIVEQEAALALAHAPRDGHDVARRIVDDRRAGLELLALGGRVVQVIAVGIDALDDGLDLGIDRAVDRVAAGVEHILRRFFVVTELLVHIGNDVVEHTLNKVGVILRARGGIHPACNPRRRNKARVPGENERLDLRLLILFVADLAQLVHLIEHRELALLVLLAVPVAARRVIFIGELRDADDGRGLGDRQLTDGLAEVALRRSLDAVAAVAEINLVKICLENFIF